MCVCEYKNKHLYDYTRFLKYLQQELLGLGVWRFPCAHCSWHQKTRRHVSWWVQVLHQPIIHMYISYSLIYAIWNEHIPHREHWFEHGNSRWKLAWMDLFEAHAVYFYLEKLGYIAQLRVEEGFSQLGYTAATLTKNHNVRLYCVALLDIYTLPIQ